MKTIDPNWLIVGGIAIALVPILVNLFTCYVKVSVVLGMVKNGLGVPHSVSVMAEMALALGITFYVMSPVIEESLKTLPSGMTWSSATAAPSQATLNVLLQAWVPWQNFLEKHSGHREVLLLKEFAPKEEDHSTEKPSVRVLLPAFVLTELRQAFLMGFVLLLPFLAIDLLVANILAGVGMHMVNPTTITLPLKLILFVLVDGWLLLTRSLILSYTVSQ